ncbi:RHO protein GDP dissociation inhibitor [Colletotrichum nymphaeae SA-01]|uniref:Rho GDP-dissociation inhibitor n=1 Tax=Colletotrichum nymphaeae SA-01 TaxID=1460502 RepID=A0A135UVW0_9PEZI|nr:RHO protein GDP dissociation inhibitor [Colletotrichum nymphaeae SA-01]
MASHEQEDTMPEETQGYKLSQPKQSLAEYQKMGDGMLDIHLMAQFTKEPAGEGRHPAACTFLTHAHSHAHTRSHTHSRTSLTFTFILTAFQPLFSSSLPPSPSPIAIFTFSALYEGMRRMMQRRNRNNALANRNSIELPPAPLSTPSGSRPQSSKMMEERHLHRARALSHPVPPNPPNSPRLQENMLTQDPNLIRDFYMSPLVVRAAHGLAVLEPLDLEQYEMRDDQPTNSTTDENDESLQRYKESLGLGGGKDLSDASDPRVCIILSLTMESPGRDPVTIDLAAPGSEATLKDKPFKIKEGAKFTMVAKFKVQHEILSGLQYVQVVKRKGIKVSKDSEMLGSYAPNTDKQTTYTKRFQEEDAPSGMLARGHYNAISSFVDDDKKTHLTFEWSFDIAKDW